MMLPLLCYRKHFEATPANLFQAIKDDPFYAEDQVDPANVGQDIKYGMFLI